MGCMHPCFLVFFVIFCWKLNILGIVTVTQKIRFSTLPRNCCCCLMKAAVVCLMSFHAILERLYSLTFFFFHILFYFLLYSIVLVLPYINMNLPRVYISSHSWTSLPPPSSYHPSGLSQYTSPKHPVSCIEPRLAIHFLHDIIHISMPFSQIIPPIPLPQSPKDCSIHLCLFCCLAYRVIITNFLNSIYMC